MLLVDSRDDALRAALARSCALARDEAGAAAILLDLRGGVTAAAEARLKRDGARVVALTDGDDASNVNRLLAPTQLCHLVGANARTPTHEIATAARQIATGDLPPAAAWIEGPSKTYRATIGGAAEIDASIHAMLAPLDLAQTFTATREHLTLVANELVTNAVYNAPVDEGGAPRYERTDRKVKVRLAEGEAVELIVHETDAEIGIEVVDRFGRLTRDTVIDRLLRGLNQPGSGSQQTTVERKPGGAGVGLYFAFHSSSRFIVQREPGRRLTVLCILEKRKRYKAHRERVTSFHYGARREAG